jgi:hypothetical protein
MISDAILGRSGSSQRAWRAKNRLYERPHPLGAQLQESGAIAVVEAPVARLR